MTLAESHAQSILATACDQDIPILDQVQVCHTLIAFDRRWTDIRFTTPEPLRTSAIWSACWSRYQPTSTITTVDEQLFNSIFYASHTAYRHSYYLSRCTHTRRCKPATFQQMFYLHALRSSQLLCWRTARIVYFSSMWRYLPLSFASAAIAIHIFASMDMYLALVARDAATKR